MFNVNDLRTMDSEIGKHLSGGKLLTNQEFQKVIDYFRKFKDDPDVRAARRDLRGIVLAPDVQANRVIVDGMLQGVLKKVLGKERGDLSLWLNFNLIDRDDIQDQHRAVRTLKNLYDALDRSSASYSHDSTFSDASFYPRRTWGGPSKRKKY